MGDRLDAFIDEVIASHPVANRLLTRVAELTTLAHDPITSCYPPEGWDADEAETIEAGNLRDIQRIVFNLDYVTLELASGRIIQWVNGEDLEDTIYDHSVSLEELVDTALKL